MLITALLFGALALAQSGDGADQSIVVARVDGISVLQSEVDAQARAELEQLRAREYEARRDALDRVIDQLLLQRAAKSEHVTVQELLTRNVDALVTPVTQVQVDQAYAGARGPLKLLPEEEGRAKIREMIAKANREQRRKEYLQHLRAAGKIDVLLAPVRTSVPDAPSAASEGPRDAPITIVEFMDVQCPSCARLSASMHELVSRHSPYVRLVVRHYPLSMHLNAAKAAEALVCAGEQDAFWPMERRLFANQQALQVDDLKAHARALELDANRFDQCLDSGRTAAAVRSDVESAKALAVPGTPSVFVNGIVIATPSIQSIERAVTDELARRRVDATQ